ncbi:MAG TPA: hypothetical protein VNT12_04190 [Rubrobacter sp.]|jgi:hypothetical protein|nr:hypothetical protein [Rubrobacter sp.]
MNSLRLLASPRIWGPVLGIVAVLALVNKDRGGDLAGKEVKLGDRVVEECSGT